MASESLRLQTELEVIKTVAGSEVPVPGDGPVLFADSENGAVLTVKMPDGLTVAFAAESITMTPLSGSPVALGQSYMTDAKLSGAVGDVVQTTTTIVALESTAIVADALSQADVGKVVSIEGAGDGADLITTITAVSADGLTVTVADAATDGGTDAITFVGTSDVAALTSADTAAAATGTMLLPPGMYLVDDDLTLAAGTIVAMRGATFVVLEGFTLEVSGYIQAAPDQLPGIADADGNGTFTHAYAEGFYATAPIAKQEITGDSTDATNLLAALDALGLITDSTT